MIGKFATSKAGHDKNTMYVIIKEEGEYVFLCDGKFKTMNHLKKKSKKHIQMIQKTVGEEILNRLYKEEKVFDHEIKYAIKIAFLK